MKNIPCDEQIVVRIPATLKDRLEEVALQQRRSVSSAARLLLEKAVQPEVSLRETWPPSAA